MALREDKCFLVRRVADRGIDKNIGDSCVRGDRLNRDRRSAGRGNETRNRDPRDIIKIKILRQRVRDLEEIKRFRQRVQDLEEIRRLRQHVRDLELQQEMRKTETESSTIVWDEGGDGEQQPFSRHSHRFLEPIYPESEPEDEPKFDEDGMLPDEGEYYWLQQAVNGANREEEEEENKDHKSLMVSSGDIQEENMEGVGGDGPMVVKGGSVASMISLPLVPEVEVGSFVDATFTEFQIKGELI
ncbi:hypothetical protein HanIR_Chr09g0415581 [Helianthus annuus]|nr:hypothetical protein HanIR_Chr09g0415581 [Helianthus annuus]